ncbi:MAG TPA: hypothetical protein VMJ32_12275 [Pirellulales bacterium]|nr:hypothetical protein [Pirellulales bacterium]
MKPTHSELCAAILAVGAEPIGLDTVSDESFQRLVDLGLVIFDGEDWKLTWAGDQLLPAMWDGQDIPNLAED